VLFPSSPAFCFRAPRGADEHAPAPAEDQPADGESAAAGRS
jgi:hypothetical protein